MQAGLFLSIIELARTKKGWQILHIILENKLFQNFLGIVQKYVLWMYIMTCWMIETFVCTYSLDSGRKTKIYNNFDFSDTHHGCWCHTERLLRKYICSWIGFCGWIQEFNIEKTGMDDNISDVPKLCYHANKREHWW